MKKITLVLSFLLSSFTILLAQAPQKMSYQSVIRKTDGTLVANILVNIKTSILLGSASGTASYVETQTATTNNNGLATIEIGGGTPVTGTFAGIGWGAGSHFIKTEIDPTGGTNYTISGTSQLLSVPYALYSGSSQNQGKTSIVITGDITDQQAAAQIAAELGPYTENIYVNGTTNLTTLDLSVVKKLINLEIVDNINLANINLNNLTEVYDGLSVSGNKKVSSITFPLLKTINGYDLNIFGNPILVSASFPLLAKTKDIYFSNNPILSSIDLPSLSSTYNSSPSLNFTRNALPSSQVNLILSKMLNVTFNSAGINLQNQNPPAPPTGQGIIDKTTLINRGYSVTTD
ncbi:hypothetical protein [[Flexibacter] sp. ATCC 35103]|uniref:hypothetical protein n=1 Tax=[Flexibacter] sp. ATCC 35103 TaxID=1937528 RepID=UPI0009D1127A|nr:hypothetical protein [[Flexibacter] sp. ATCC 35103]OMQ13231.1 hypothetical protein BXU01_01765 [[Flexibacter] sp. ATCC 35103]